MNTITLIKLTYIQIVQSMTVTCDLTFDGCWTAILRGPHNKGYTVCSSSEDLNARARALVYLGVHVMNEALEIKHPSNVLKCLIRDLLESLLADAAVNNISLGALEKYRVHQRIASAHRPMVDTYA